MAAPAPSLRFPAVVWKSVLSLSGVKVAVSAQTPAQASTTTDKKQNRPILLPTALRKPSGASRGAARRNDESHPAPSDNVPRPPPSLLHSSLILADHRILHESAPIFEERLGNFHWHGRKR